MKILLVAVNAKYIHSNPAVYSLKRYALEKLEQCARLSDEMEPPTEIELAEYTINQQMDDILRDIYEKAPDMLCFSCYIWNRSCMENIIREIGKICPQLPVWAGGPEVSYDASDVLRRLPSVKGVMKGEGEETFYELVSAYIDQRMEERPIKDKGKPCSKSGESLDRRLQKIKGITFRMSDGTVVDCPWREPIDLTEVPFVYQDMERFEHKIIYYETSRGCPFSCSYCLSSVDKRLRFRDMGIIKKELQFFLDQKVPQVKFVDRTFNCRHNHAQEIWRYLLEHDNGITNFHFEISADLLNEEELSLMEQMRPGLIQLEIGVQSTNQDTIREIRRTMDFEKVKQNVERVHSMGNIHQHLDLIAGLPFEDIQSFERSFNDVYALRPDQLQLGFLKVLKGSYMEEKQEDYGLVYKSMPPYEVLYTRWLSYGDVLRLKGVEEMVEVYYNSLQFTSTLAELDKLYTSAFTMYEELWDYYCRQGYQGVAHKRAARYEILQGFIKMKFPQKANRFLDLLIYDYYLRENAKSRPEFAGENRLGKDAVRRFYEQETAEWNYLTGYERYDRSQVRKMTHLEHFPALGKTVLFDYQKRNPLSHEAQAIEVRI